MEAARLAERHAARDAEARGERHGRAARGARAAFRAQGVEPRRWLPGSAWGCRWPGSAWRCRWAPGSAWRSHWAPGSARGCWAPGSAWRSHWAPGSARGCWAPGSAATLGSRSAKGRGLIVACAVGRQLHEVAPRREVVRRLQLERRAAEASDTHGHVRVRVVGDDLELVQSHGPAGAHDHGHRGRDGGRGPRKGGQLRIRPQLVVAARRAQVGAASLTREVGDPDGVRRSRQAQDLGQHQQRHRNDDEHRDEGPCPYRAQMRRGGWRAGSQTKRRDRPAPFRRRRLVVSLWVHLHAMRHGPPASTQHHRRAALPRFRPGIAFPVRSGSNRAGRRMPARLRRRTPSARGSRSPLRLAAEATSTA